MTIDELLTELENWPPTGTSDYDSALQSASRLLHEAAAAIRQLTTTPPEDHRDMT